jgi:hypothetical protein
MREGGLVALDSTSERASVVICLVLRETYHGNHRGSPLHLLPARKHSSTVRTLLHLTCSLMRTSLCLYDIRSACLHITRSSAILLYYT